MERTYGFMRISGQRRGHRVNFEEWRAQDIAGNLGVWEMKEKNDFLRIAGIILLGLFILVVGVPLVMAAAGITLGIVGMVFGLAVGLIKLAIVVAVIYLVLVGIRALLR